MKKMPRIAVYGGSFNPPHLGHGRVIEYLSGTFDQVWVIPQVHHAFGKKLLPWEVRAQMIRIQSRHLSNVNLVRREEVYTVEMFEHLFVEHPFKLFTFVMGEENKRDAERWYRWDDLNRLVPIIYIHRPGSGVEGGVEIDSFDVSSTELRETLARGESHPLIDPEVLNFIRVNGLYL